MKNLYGVSHSYWLEGSDPAGPPNNSVRVKIVTDTAATAIEYAARAVAEIETPEGVGEIIKTQLKSCELLIDEIFVVP